MNIEAFPCPSRYIEGNEKIRNAVTHHGIVQANSPRKPARQADTSAATKQIDKQVNPTLKGQVRVQNPAFAPSGVRKYPYVRLERGTSIVKARLCHNQTKRITITAAKKGRSVFVRRKTARLSQAAERPSATHHPTKTKGMVSHPCCSPMTIVTGVANNPRTNGTMVARAISMVVADFSGIVILSEILDHQTFTVSDYVLLSAQLHVAGSTIKVSAT